MTLFYPPVEDFHRQRRPEGLAHWLLTAAPTDLDRHEGEIVRHLRLTGQHGAQACLDRMLRSFRSPRRADGALGEGLAYALACGRLSRMRDGLPPLGLGEWWP